MAAFSSIDLYYPKGVAGVRQEEAAGAVRALRREEDPLAEQHRDPHGPRAPPAQSAARWSVARRSACGKDRSLLPVQRDLARPF